MTTTDDIPDEEKYPQRWSMCDGGYVYKPKSEKLEVVLTPEESRDAQVQDRR